MLEEILKNYCCVIIEKKKRIIFIYVKNGNVY